MSNKVLEQYENAILSATQYSGDQSKGLLRMNASSITDDDLRLYLQIKNGVNSEQVKEISQSTIGSLMHIAIEFALKDTEFMVEKRFNQDFVSDSGKKWKLSGQIDCLHIDYEKKQVVIIDNKLSKQSALDMIAKEDKHDNAYTVQQNIYKLLVILFQEKPFDVIDESWSFSMYLALYRRDSTLFSKKNIEPFQWVKIKQIPVDVLISMVREKANRLDNYLLTNTEPPECKNLLWSKSYSGVGSAPSDKATKVKCTRYCSVSNTCSYFKWNYDKNKQQSQSMDALAALGL